MAPPPVPDQAASPPPAPEHAAPADPDEVEAEVEVANELPARPEDMGPVIDPRLLSDELDDDVLKLSSTPTNVTGSASDHAIEELIDQIVSDEPNEQAPVGDRGAAQPESPADLEAVADVAVKILGPQGASSTPPAVAAEPESSLIAEASLPAGGDELTVGDQNQLPGTGAEASGGGNEHNEQTREDLVPPAADFDPGAFKSLDYHLLDDAIEPPSFDSEPEASRRDPVEPLPEATAETAAERTGDPGSAAPAPQDPGGALADDGALWAAIEAGGGESTPDAPSFANEAVAAEADAADEPDDDPLLELERVATLAEAADETVAGETSPGGEADAYSPDPEFAADDAPPIYVAARQAQLAGANALPIDFVPTLDPKQEIDEIAHALGAFGDLEYGQIGFLRLSLRTRPEFKAEAKEWLRARKRGEDPDAKQSKGGSIWGWIRYVGSYLAFQINDATSGGRSSSMPPVPPHKRGENLKKLPASDVDEDEKQAWKEASLKARDPGHFEALLRVGVVGEHDDEPALEQIAEEVMVGLEAFDSEHENQKVTWGTADPYDALLGLMGTRSPDDVPMVLAAIEAAAICHLPDNLCNPHGVNVVRSSFKTMPIPNPIRVDDAYAPPSGVIPIGVQNPRSEDAQVIGLNNSELDRHLILAGKTGTGKALCVDTPIPTPSGWKRMGDLKRGDFVFDEHGQPTRVVEAFPVLFDRAVYEVEFSDGSKILADGDHRWLTETRAARIASSKPPHPVRLKSWARKLQAAEHEARGNGRLGELVNVATIVRELGVSLNQADKALAAAAAAGEVQRVKFPVVQSYGEEVITKMITRPVTSRQRFYTELRADVVVKSRPRAEAKVVTTEEIMASLRTRTGHANHSIDILSGPLEFERKDLPIDPYLLGLWLGDGNARACRITSADYVEIDAAVRSLGYETKISDEGNEGSRVVVVYKQQQKLRDLDLLCNKHIPKLYATAAPDQRWALLEGLLDTDGGVDRGGSCEFYSSNQRLAHEVFSLVAGLGMRPQMRTKETSLNGESHKTAYTVSFIAPRKVFRLTRKRRLQKTERSKRAERRYITAVRRVSSRPVRCIAVDSPSHLYLAGESCIPTHNSELMKWLIFGVAKAGYPLVVDDPHGALCDDVLKALIINCPERADDIVYCDLSDSEYPVAFNPLDISNPAMVEPTVQSVMEMLATQMSLDSTGAPRATIFAKQALTALTEANLVLDDPDTKMTLLDVVPFFNDAEFRQLVVNFSTNLAVRQQFDPDTGPFEKMSERQQQELGAPINRAFSMLAASSSFAAVFSSGENKFNLGRLVAENKIILVKLSRFSHQAKLGEFVGALIVPWLLASMDDWGRKKNAETGHEVGTGCRVFVDEAPRLFRSPESSVIQALAEARKWDLGVIMAAQFLNQFPREVKESALNNTASKIGLHTDMSGASEIAKALGGATKAIADGDMVALPNFHFYGNILLPSPGAGLAPSGPFSAACLHPIKDKLSPEQIELRETVIARSRQLVTNRLDVVKAQQRIRLENVKTALSHRFNEQATANYTPVDLLDDDEDLDGGDTSWATFS